MIRDICGDNLCCGGSRGKAHSSTTRKQGAGAWGFSGALLFLSFLVWIFVRLDISGCGFGVSRAASFAADQILTGV